MGEDGLYQASLLGGDVSLVHLSMGYFDTFSEPLMITYDLGCCVAASHTQGLGTKRVRSPAARRPASPCAILTHDATTSFFFSTLHLKHILN